MSFKHTSLCSLKSCRSSNGLCHCSVRLSGWFIVTEGCSDHQCRAHAFKVASAGHRPGTLPMQCINGHDQSPEPWVHHTSHLHVVDTIVPGLLFRSVFYPKISSSHVSLQFCFGGMKEYQSVLALIKGHLRHQSFTYSFSGTALAEEGKTPKMTS